jgi:hypothetical protein
MYPRNIYEAIQRYLSIWNTEFMVKFPLSSTSNSECSFRNHFLLYGQGMRTTCIRPHIWECNLFTRAFLH